MNKEPFIIMVMGRTASGKTTTSKYLSRILGAEYISFSEYKRFVTNNNYTVSDCFRQDLRDKGYHLAIEHAKMCLMQQRTVVLDASFYQQSRRVWVYKQFSLLCNFLVRVYCITSDLIETQRRITKRKGLEKVTEHQASDISVFEFIDSNFDELCADEHAGHIDNYFDFEIDTFQRVVKKKGGASENIFPVIDSIYTGLNQFLLPESLK